MRMQRHNWVVVGAGGLYLATLAGCGGDDSPGLPTVTLSAPLIISPEAGAQVATDQPTLVIGNATASDGSAPAYTFQVATDSAFSNVVARVDGVGQGSDGRTSWTVATPLGNGQHFWRARGRASGADGPFSAASDFSVLTAFKSDVARDGTLVFDPLTSGFTVGVVNGGEFTPSGWKVTASSNYLFYDLPTIENGSVEFDVAGLDIRNPTRDARHLVIMWDPSLGSDFTSNRFRVSLQKLDNRSSINDRWLRLRFITQGRQIDASSTFRDWHPDRVYHIRLAWGRDGDALVCRLLVDDRELMSFEYPRPYIPVIHRIELGAGIRAESPENAIYSNVRVTVSQ